MRKFAVPAILAASLIAAGSASAQSGAGGGVNSMTNVQGPYQSLDQSWRARHDEMRERMTAKRKASPAVVAAKAKTEAKAAKLAQVESRVGS